MSRREMRETEEMPLLRSALGPTGRPFGDGLHYAMASGTGGRKAATTRSWDMAGSTLKKPIRGRRIGVGARVLELSEFGHWQISLVVASL
jgi:hypothetical protein